MKKQGISGQSVDPDKAKAIADRPRVEKDFRSKQLIREAIMENDFLKHLAPSQVREIVDYMEKKKVKTSFKKLLVWHFDNLHFKKASPNHSNKSTRLFL